MKVVGKREPPETAFDRPVSKKQGTCAAGGARHAFCFTEELGIEFEKQSGP